MLGTAKDRREEGRTVTPGKGAAQTAASLYISPPDCYPRVLPGWVRPRNRFIRVGRIMRRETA